MLSFEQFKETNQRPNVVLVDPLSVDCKSLSDMKSMSQDEVLNGTFVQVCDGMQWLCTTTDPRGRIAYISSDGEKVYQFTAKRNSMLGYVLNSERKLELSINDRLTFNEPVSVETKNQEETPMQEDKTRPSIDDLIGQVTAEQGAPAATMTAFSAPTGTATDSAKIDDAKNERAEIKRVAEETLNKIKSEAREVGALEDISLLQDAWNKAARHLVWITPNDARDTISAVKKNIPVAQRELVANAPDAVKAQNKRNPGTVDPQYYQSVYGIEARRSKPGKPKGAIAYIPAYLKGKSVQDFTTQLVTQGPKSPADVMSVIEIMTVDEYEQKLTLVGGSIKEAPETHGGTPSEIRISYSVGKAKANAGTGIAVNIGMTLNKKFTRVGSGNKTTLMGTNYFPLTTYDTYDIYSPLPADIIDQLNVSCFESLFGGLKATPSKYRALPIAEQQNIHQTESGITSNYITSNTSNLIKLEVKEFFNKEIVRDTIRIPLKVRTTKPDGTLSALSFVKYSVTADPKKMADPEYAKKTALYDPRFKHIVDLCGTEVLNPEKLRSLFKGGNGGEASKNLDSLTARALLKAKLFGKGFEEYTVQGLKLAA